MNNKNEEYVKFGDSYVFHIINEKETVTAVERFGYFGDILEIKYSLNSNSIVSVDCIICYNLREKNINLPNHNSLININNAKLIIDNNEDDDFLIYYNSNEMNIIIKDISYIKSYYTIDRIDYYFDNDEHLCGIRVRNLTHEEYNILKNEELEPGHYMKNKNIESKQTRSR